MGDEVEHAAVALCSGDAEGSTWGFGRSVEDAAREAVREAVTTYDPWEDYADDFQVVVVYIDPVWVENKDGDDEIKGWSSRAEMRFADVLARMRADGEVDDG